ncbi:hypothetical protein BHM03_00062402 [Ensete ventricosum]|nr:hypothetical protein BHM03_00062402 [Ensete ventricosum]
MRSHRCFPLFLVASDEKKAMRRRPRRRSGRLVRFFSSVALSQCSRATNVFGSRAATMPLEGGIVQGSPTFSSSVVATRLIPLGSGQRMSKPTVTARYSLVSDGTRLEPRYHPVADGSRTVYNTDGQGLPYRSIPAYRVQLGTVWCPVPSVTGGNNRYLVIPPDSVQPVYRSVDGLKKREKKRENLEIWHCSPDLVSSLAGDFFSPRGLSPHREKERGDYRHTAPYRAEFGMTVRYGLAYEIVVEMAAYL